MSLLDRLNKKPAVSSKLEENTSDSPSKDVSVVNSENPAKMGLASRLAMKRDLPSNGNEKQGSIASGMGMKAKLSQGLDMKEKLSTDVDLMSRLNSRLGSASTLPLGETIKLDVAEKIKLNTNQELALPEKEAFSAEKHTVLAKEENIVLPAKEEILSRKSENVDEQRNMSANLGLSAKLGASRIGLGSRLGGNNIDYTAPTEPKGQKAASKLAPKKENGMQSLQYQNLKLEIHRQIVDGLSIEQQKIITNANSDRHELEKIIVDLCNKVIDENNPFAIPRADRSNIVNDIIDEVLGLGPIEPLLKDETVSEVMINGPKMIYVERKGKLTLTNVQFQDETHLMNIVERIVAPLGRRIDESSPLVDARLADGSRVNVIIPPLALNGACVTIRKFAKDPLTVDNLIGFGSLDEQMASLIKSCVLGRLNIVVSGGTGSGKTTTLNVLSSFIPEDERIVTIEDAAELQLRQDHVVTLESRPANVEGNGQVSIRDLVRNALRMRPDRIVVGECRSGEALDMLQAMNTGHDGSLTTAHANSPRDVLSRLETMVLMAGMDLPVKAIREQIASAVDLIIQQSRLRDGSRKITYITEVQGMEGEVIVLQDLFRFEQAGLDEDGKLKGEFKTTGIRPKFLEKLETNGIKLDTAMFLGNIGWDD